MKVIDAHLHFSQAIPEFAEQAQAVGHVYTEEHLRAKFARLGIECGVVMGNGGLDLEEHEYPALLRYCIVLDSNGESPEEMLPEQLEAHL